MQPLSVEVFNPKKAEIIETVKKFEGLTIAGIDDKEGFERVHKAQMELRDLRVWLEKTGKSAREDALNYQKIIIALEKELIAEITPTEERLKAEKERINQEKEAIEQAKKDKEVQRIKAMTDQLEAVWYTTYDPFIIAVITPEAFSDLLAKKTLEFEQAEKLRLEAEAKAKADALELEQLRAEKAKMAEESAKIETEKARIAQEEARVIREKEIAEKARIETEARIAREAEAEKVRIESERLAKEAQEKAETARIEKGKKYQAFLARNEVTKENVESGEIKLLDVNGVRTIYKKIDSFIL